MMNSWKVSRHCRVVFCILPAFLAISGLCPLPAQTSGGLSRQGRRAVR